jgi:hypothetical protein
MRSIKMRARGDDTAVDVRSWQILLQKSVERGREA